MNFDTIHDEIYSTISATFPTKTELKNPYDIADNDGHMLKNGYGVVIGAISLSDAFSRQIRQFRRDVRISLTKRILSSDQKTSIRKAAEKSLVSDELTLITALKNNISSEFVEFVGDEGIEYIFDEREDYIRLQCNFIINYVENVRYLWL